MESSDDEDIREFFKNLTGPIGDPKVFLKEHGLSFVQNKNHQSDGVDYLQQGPSSEFSITEENFKQKLDKLQEELFGSEEPTIDEPSKELLDSLLKDVQKLCIDDNRPTVRTLRHETSLFKRNYNVDAKNVSRSKVSSKENDDTTTEDAVNYAKGMEFLSQTFKHFQGTQEKAEEDKKSKCPLTVMELAEILATAAGEPSKSLRTSSDCPSDDCLLPTPVQKKDDCDLENVTEKKSDSENTNELCSSIDEPNVSSAETSEIKLEENVNNENNHSSEKDNYPFFNKKTKKKKKRENEYQPKRVPIVWSNPFEDSNFEKELEKVMCCDSFPLDLSKEPLERELDELIGNFDPPRLPRNIIDMLTTGSERDFADWEHSIMAEKDGLSESDSEVEEILKKSKVDLEKLVMGSPININKPRRFPEKFENPVQIDTLEFMHCFMPPNPEEIVGVRDDILNIITYDTVERNDEHLGREIERIYAGRESDEESDDEEDKIEEDQQEEEEKDVLKENKPLYNLGNLTEQELLKELENYKEYAEQLKSTQTEEPFDSKLTEQMKKVDEFLDKIGVPKAGHIEEMSVDQHFEEETKKFSHILELHKDETCPPGILEVDVNEEDKDENDKYYCELGKESDKDKFKTIFRSAKSHVIFPDDEADNKEEPIPAVEPQEITVKPEQLSFDKEQLTDEESDDNIYNIFEGDSSSESDRPEYYISSESDEEEKKSKKEEHERMLDENFKKEYYRRGGTREGLENSSDESDIDIESHLRLEPLDSFSEKFLTFPFQSKHTGKVDLLRVRRLIAENFPKFRKEVFTDLSKDIDLTLSTSESSSDEEVHFNPKPFDLYKEVEKPASLKFSDYDDVNLDIPGGSVEIEPDTPPFVTPRVLKDLIEEVKVRRSKKRRRKRIERKTECSKDSSTNSSEGEEEEEEEETIEAVWCPPIDPSQSSPDAVKKVMEILHPIVVNPPPKFKIPKHMKSWLRGNYEPSKDTLKKWKQLFIDFYGNQTMLDKVINSEDCDKYEEFLETLEGNLGLEEEETNMILKFKYLMQEKKQKAEKEDEVDACLSQEVVGSEKGEINKDETKKNEIVEKKESDEDMNVNEDLPKTNAENNETQTPTESDDKHLGEESEAPKLPTLPLRALMPVVRKEEWAEEVNCRMTEDIILSNQAMTFSFNLDGFQKQAIKALENGNNVFVSAHTSAGKTVVAEYAIAMSKRNRSKSVYTSPVKALSNQKYADFKRIFGSVGLITGDIQLNENAECLIMTTEILRSMLYNSSEKIRDLEYVVFDEVHYINDPERGHVWEEVLILLPPQVKIVMLSATVPNTLEFANWVGRTKQRKVIVCATQQRPVPLNHYIYTGTGGSSPGSCYLLKSGDGQFLSEQYTRAEKAMKEAHERERQNKRKQAQKRYEEEREWKSKRTTGNPSVPAVKEDYVPKYFKQDQTMWIALIAFLEKNDWLPAVSFVFSRKKCDNFADMLSNVDLTTKSEKSYIHKFIKSQIEKLDEVDQDLPQIQIMKKQLDKGIGVHHSGILPIMKEIVEVLFQEGKVKLLFATETFAMGVNMPARTVIFHTVKKFDGNETRLLRPAEYVQMAGRAGRRGKDSAGNVIILSKPNDIIPRHDLETLLYGNPSKLISKFRLSYRMILNTLTVSGMLTVQNMMERSFCENHGQLERKSIETQLIEAISIEENLKRKMSSSVNIMEVEDMAKFYDYALKYIEEWNSSRLDLLMLSNGLKELYAGRLVKICSGSFINRTALILESEVSPEKPSLNSYRVLLMGQSSEYERCIATDGQQMSKDELETWYRMVSLMDNQPLERDISDLNNYTTLVVKCNNIVSICKESAKLPKNLLCEYLSHLKRKSQTFSSKNTTSEAGDKIARILYSHTGSTTEINEREALKHNFDAAIRAAEMWSLLDEIKKIALSCRSPLIMNSFRKVFCWKQALRKVEEFRHKLSSENMSLYPDFCSKMQLLKEKAYINKSEHVLMKGYMAARIGKYELVVCELLMENVLVNLSPEEVAALLSFLVYQTNSEGIPLETTLPNTLIDAIEKCKNIMSEVSDLERCHGIRDYDGSETSKLKFGLVPVMYKWAKQTPLKDIMDLPIDFEFQEGMLVRWIQQLLETLKEVESAARLMGDPSVPAKLLAAGQSIKRGIVFAPSLYTTMQ